MDLRLPPYPEYKDSGVDWLGEVPSHWEVYPHRSLFTEIIERDYPDEQMLSVTLARGVLPQSQLLASSSKKDSSNTDKSNYKLVSEGDITYNKMRAWQGAIGASAYRGIISPAYIVVRLRNEENKPWYFHYLFRTPRFMTEAERWSYGITSDQWSLRYGEFKQIYSPLPPPAEQAAIVRFLDAAETRIRRYIRAKQKLIKLLNEQKQAIIQQAVTRGLDPDAPMKDSGVAWLGEIPSHWEDVRLAYVIDLKPGYAFRSSEFTQNSDDIPLLRGINVAPDAIRWESVVYWSGEVSDYLREFELQLGDIVIGMDRPVISGGTRVALISERDVPSLLLQRVARIRVKKELDQQYLLFLLSGKSFSDYLAPIFTGISVPHVSGEQIESFRIALPPIDDQKQIIEYVKSKTFDVEKAIKSTYKEIDLIREYRTRLIADVVTGKVDVRGLAFEMPEAFDEDALLDVDADDLLEEEEGDMEMEVDE